MDPDDGAKDPGDGHRVSALRAAIPFFFLGIVLCIIVAAAMFLFMGNQCGSSCSYGPSASLACTGETITITYEGEGRYPSSVVNISAYDTDPAGTRTMGGPDGLLPVGSRLVLEGPFFLPSHIIAIAQMQDGTRMVILDTPVKCGSGPARTRTPAP